ncbi:MAG: Lhr family helicase, partial [Vicinamibacterales bacterium]
LCDARRATHATIPAPGARVWVAAERLPELFAVCRDAVLDDNVCAPASRTERVWTQDEALVELLRGRLALVGPTTARELAQPLGIAETGANAALETLESQGVVLRGEFRSARLHSAPLGAREPRPTTVTDSAGPAFGRAVAAIEWCDRRLLARIHRYTLNRLRAEIEPVSQADFMRFQFDWQHVSPASRLSGADGLLHVIGRLDGFEVAAGAWESSVLPARMDRYDPSMLDMLCLTGRVGWARLSAGTSSTRLVKSTPIAFFRREHATAWKSLGRSSAEAEEDGASNLTLAARKVLDSLRSRGASFTHELSGGHHGLSDNETRQALAELVSAGLAASDGFAGLRVLIADRESPHGGHTAGRWAAIHRDEPIAAIRAARDRPRPSDASRSRVEGSPASRRLDDDTIEVQARALLDRYGVICRRLLTREANALPWRVLARACRRLEARGDIRGGRFVAGLSGEQFALPEAVERLREVRRTPQDHRVVVISAADPLNLAGIVTSGERVPAVAATRLAYRDGVALAAMEGDYIRPLAEVDPAIAGEVASALAGRRVPPVISGFVGRAG